MVKQEFSLFGPIILLVLLGSLFFVTISYMCFIAISLCRVKVHPIVEINSDTISSYSTDSIISEETVVPIN